jgi:TonB family protein
MERSWLLIVIFCLVMTGLVAMAQNAGSDTVLTIAQQMPEYPGGHDSLMKEIVIKTVYPKQCLDSNIQGKVFIRFIVNEDGSISNPQAVKGPHPLLKAAAIEAIKTIGRFTPAINNGKAVRVWYSLPVNFTIRETAKAPQKPSSIVFIREYFPDGGAKFDAFIKNNLRNPKEAERKELDAIIWVECSLNTSLKLLPVKVMNDLENIYSDEALRLVNMMPSLNDSIKKHFEPGVIFIAPITFLITPNGTSAPDVTFRNGSLEILGYRDFYNTGVKEFEEKQYSWAVGSFTQAIKLNPRDADAFFNRAVAKLELDNKAGACDDFKRAYLLGALDAMNAIRKTCE